MNRETNRRPTVGRRIDSPLGPLLLSADETALTHLLFDRETGDEPLQPPTGRAAGILDYAERELAEYFAGRRRDFDLPVSPTGTDFQRQVWTALQDIPWGETISYGELARRVGRPTAARAVGTANGANPISVVIPCHRVIGSDGTLHGYGGGLPAKRLLLSLEGAM